MDEALLPPAILAKATLRTNEYAWPIASVEEAIFAAQASGLATLGDQAQFRIPDGTCEMYWLDADASDRRASEPWPEFVTRSAQQVLARFKDKVVAADFVFEARQWPILREKIATGVNVLDYLCFVLYFQAEPGRTDMAPHGYRGDVVVELADGEAFPVYFYEPDAVREELDDRIRAGFGQFVAEPGLVVIPEITLPIMKAAVLELIEVGYFTHLKPVCVKITGER